MKDAALYLEADEDITSAIDKLQKLPGDTVQIVVPKRSTMLQSVINLKLLKKAAADAKKDLVLVTNDRVATGLAGRLGLAVAPSLGAEAVVHEVKEPEPLQAEEVIEAEAPKPTSTAVVADAAADVADGPEAEAALAAGVPAFSHRQLDEELSASEEGAADAPKPSPDTAPKPAKAAKVPNFNLMQKRLLWVGLAGILFVGYWMFMAFFTSAKVQLQATASKISVTANITVDPTASKTDVAGAVLAGQMVSYSKDLTSTFTATGQQDNGTKASGTVTVKNCGSNTPVTIPAGTTFSAGGLDFVSTTAATVSGAVSNIHSTCAVAGTGTVSLAASANGDQYNLTNASFSSSSLGSGFTATGSMSGGTSNIVTVVQQSDIDSAKTAALTADKSGGFQGLSSHVPNGYVAITASQTQAAASVTSTPAVGGQGSSASLDVKVTYSELAVAKTDYDAVLQQLEQNQVGSGNQIYDDGLSGAQLTANGAASSTGRQSFNLVTTAYSGAKINLNALAGQLAGKPYKDAADIGNAEPGVQQTAVSLWPAWASNLPRNAGKIKISIQVAQ